MSSNPSAAKITLLIQSFHIEETGHNHKNTSTGENSPNLKRK
jgi:hypothetical protein